MEKRTINSYVPIVSHESAAVAQPRKGALDFVPTLVAAKLSSILRRFLCAIGTMRANKFYAAQGKTLSQWVRIVAAICYETFGLAFWRTRPLDTAYRRTLEDVPQSMPAAQRAGDGCEIGKSRMSDSTCGGHFLARLMSEASLTGASALSMAVSHLPKKAPSFGDSASIKY